MATFTFAHPISLAFVSLKVVILHGTSLQFCKTSFMLCFFIKSSRFSVLTTPPMQNCIFFLNNDFFASPKIKEVADRRQGSSFFSFFIFKVLTQFRRPLFILLVGWLASWLAGRQVLVKPWVYSALQNMFGVPVQEFCWVKAMWGALAELET